MLRAVTYAFLSCRLDYCNSLLYGVSDGLMRKLHSIQNAATQLITGTRRCGHITHVLHYNWLPVRRQVNYKIACLVHQSLSGLALAYLADDVNLVADIADSFSDQQPTGLVSSHVHTPWVTGVSLLPVCGCGTIYRLSCDRTSATVNSNDN